MEPTQSGTDDTFPHLQTDGDSVPWTPREILAEARKDADAERCATLSVPFVLQSGPMLLMVEQADDGWTLAELDFHPRYCVFQEKRRVTYTWPREAFGAMLSRLAGADVDDEAITRLTREFSEWIGARFARVSRSGPRVCEVPLSKPWPVVPTLCRLFVRPTQGRQYGVVRSRELHSGI